MDLKVRVKSGSVDLYITLTPKLLAKSLQGALINPFIKAYNKREKDQPVTWEALTSIMLTDAVDGDVALADGSISIADASNDGTSASSLLGTQPGATIELFFKASDPVDVSEKPPPRRERMPMDEEMSEVEKLKARRRAANAAPRAAALVISCVTPPRRRHRRHRRQRRRPPLQRRRRRRPLALSARLSKRRPS
jgi:hypothetical protein